MFSQLMETAEPWFSTFEHDGQKVNCIVQVFSIYLRGQIISTTAYNQRNYFYKKYKNTRGIRLN